MRQAHELSRRRFIAGGAAAALGACLGRTSWARAATAATVSIAKCQSYGAELVPALARMFDEPAEPTGCTRA